MDYWILLEKGKPITKHEMRNGCLTNNLPFTYDEAMELKNSEHINAKCINISEDIKKQEIVVDEKLPLEEEQKIFHAWHSNFLHNKIKGFSMPRIVSNNDDYIDELKKLFEEYKKEIQKIAFKYEENLVDDIKNNCDRIIKALRIYLSKDTNNAKIIISSLIKQYIEDPFWVSELDKSYAFRGLAPFADLHSEDYEEKYAYMMENDIDFYRARTEKVARDRKEVLHIPYENLHLIKEQRFSLNEQPCLYLGTTSYVCWTECRKPPLEKFYLAGFRANESGKKLKVFNLVASEALVNGIYQKGTDEPFRKELQISMLKLLPIVFATSFSVNSKDREEKYEYIIPQLVMQSLSELNIDGVAYLSKQGKDDYQYPQGVNLAIPVLDISNGNQYGEVCSKFVITEPKGFYEFKKNSTQKNETSYLNKAFKDYFTTKEYNKCNKQYSLVDNSIAGEKYDTYR